MSKRAAHVLEVAHGVRRAQEAIARQLAREQGKAIWEARAEVTRSVDMIDAIGARPCKKGLDGAVLVETGWSMPFWEPAVLVCSALLTGRPVILSPSGLCPGPAIHLAELIHLVLPPGVFQLLLGDTLAILAGEVPPGLRYWRRDKKHPRTLNPTFVLPSARIETVAPLIMRNCFANAGQRPGASRLVLIGETQGDLLTTALLNLMEKLRVGHALDPETAMGPLISADHRAAALGFVQRQQECGGFIKIGAGGDGNRDGGNFLRPAFLVLSSAFPDAIPLPPPGPIAWLALVEDIDTALQVMQDAGVGGCLSIFGEPIDIERSRLDKRRWAQLFVNRSSEDADFAIDGVRPPWSAGGTRPLNKIALEPS